MVHSPTMPIWRTTLIEISCNNAICSLDNVMIGETTILSPVWIPSGSTFSIGTTVKQWSLASRIISNSISFQPFKDSSTRICFEYANELSHNSTNSFSLVEIPDPRPPSAYAERTITGYPRRRATISASSIDSTACDDGVFASISCNFFTNKSRSSVIIMASTEVPKTFTPYFCNVPERYNEVPQFNAVCPPNASKIPSGCSFLITSSTKYGVTGRKYTLSAIPSDVWIV